MIMIENSFQQYYSVKWERYNEPFGVGLSLTVIDVGNEIGGIYPMPMITAHLPKHAHTSIRSCGVADVMKKVGGDKETNTRGRNIEMISFIWQNKRWDLWLEKKKILLPFHRFQIFILDRSEIQ